MEVFGNRAQAPCLKGILKPGWGDQTGSLNQKCGQVVQTKPSKEREAEAMLEKEVFAGATEMEDTLHQVLEKHGFWQAIIMYHVMGSKIYQNLDKKDKKYQLSGSLTTCQTDKQMKFWVAQVKQRHILWRSVQT